MCVGSRKGRLNLGKEVAAVGGPPPLFPQLRGENCFGKSGVRSVG